MDEEEAESFLTVGDLSGSGGLSGAGAFGLVGGFAVCGGGGGGAVACFAAGSAIVIAGIAGIDAPGGRGAGIAGFGGGIAGAGGSAVGVDVDDDDNDDAPGVDSIGGATKTGFVSLLTGTAGVDLWKFGIVGICGGGCGVLSFSSFFFLSSFFLSFSSLGVVVVVVVVVAVVVDDDFGSSSLFDDEVVVVGSGTGSPVVAARRTVTSAVFDVPGFSVKKSGAGGSSVGSSGVVSDVRGFELDCQNCGSAGLLWSSAELIVATIDASLCLENPVSVVISRVLSSETLRMRSVLFVENALHSAANPFILTWLLSISRFVSVVFVVSIFAIAPAPWSPIEFPEMSSV